MIKAEIVEEKEGPRLYIEGQSEADTDALDAIYKVIMSRRPKVGGFSNSLKFDVLLLEDKREVNET